MPRRFISNPTPHQLAIFDAVSKGKGNKIVLAAAGSGKTSTIMDSMLGLPSKSKILYVVFAKKNQLEAEEKLAGTQVKVKTLNGLGFGCMPWLSNGARWDVQGEKPSQCWKLLADEIGLEDDERRLYKAFACRMVGLARAVGIGIQGMVADVPKSWIELADHHGIDSDSDDFDIRRGVDLASQLLSRMIKHAQTANVIDYDDQLYLPQHPAFAGRFPRPDVIFVDEAQDLSPIQIELVARCMGARPNQPVPAGKQRAVFVGDDWQAIYGFRGADCDAMAKIKTRFACDELPLSVCFRCARKFVELAAELGAPIQPSATAIPGELVRWPGGDRPFRAPEGATVLCRATAPLVAAAYRLIRQGRPAIVLGRKIGEGLVSLVEQMKARSLVDLTQKLNTWITHEVERLEGNEKRQEQARDKVDCVLVLIEMLGADETVSGLIRKITSLFDDVQRTGVTTLCTIHKAKGLEWNDVVILNGQSLPAKYPQQDWQNQQERHIAYVAYTRAKRRMWLVAAEDFEREDRPAATGAAAPVATAADDTLTAEEMSALDSMRDEILADLDAGGSGSRLVDADASAPF